MKIVRVPIIAVETSREYYVATHCFKQGCRNDGCRRVWVGVSSKPNEPNLSLLSLPPCFPSPALSPTLPPSFPHLLSPSYPLSVCSLHMCMYVRCACSVIIEAVCTSKKLMPYFALCYIPSDRRYYYIHIHLYTMHISQQASLPAVL